MGHRVLIVDDDALTLGALGRIVEARGHHATTASTGAAAIELVEREIFDVVLCDINLPDMSGVEVLRRCVMLGGRMRLVAMTGIPDPAYAVDAKALGVHEFLGKPVQIKDVVRIVCDAPGSLVVRDPSENARPLDWASLVSAPMCVREALKIIERRLAESHLGVGRLASEARVSASHLSREFARSLGRNPFEHLHDVRVAHAEWLLIHTASSVKEVAAQCGCCSGRSLARHFVARTGLLPTAYRAIG